jgi:hypothetical protein
MTERHDTGKPEETRAEYRPTLGELSHTNPYTGDVFGDTQTYGRGRFVAADGGADPEREAGVEAESDEETLKDVDHTPPDEGDGAAPVYERGHEGRKTVREPDEDVREAGEDVR